MEWARHTHSDLMKRELEVGSPKSSSFQQPFRIRGSGLSITQEYMSGISRGTKSFFFIRVL